MKRLHDGSWLTKERIYSICILLFALLCNQLSYQGSRLLSFWRHHYDYTIPLDEEVPFMTWTVLIYVGAFVFWALNLYLISLQDREHSDRLLCADVLSKIASFVFFVVIPTTSVRPEVTGTSLLDDGMRFIFWIDAGDNLFPSMHCSMSWLCWIGLRGRKNVPLGYRVFSLLFALAICVSTLTTKQHVFVDTISGIALAELCWLVAANPRIRGVYTRFIDRLVALVERFRDKRMIKE